MKIVVYGPERRVGAWEGERIIDLNRAFARYLQEGRGAADPQRQADSEVPSRLDEFITGGRRALDGAQRAIEQVAKTDPEGTVVHRADQVKLHAPWPGKRVACVGGNYGLHLLGMRANQLNNLGQLTLHQVVKEARDGGHWGFWKVIAEAAGPGDDVPYPHRTQYHDYEGEVAIVIGTRAKDVPASKIDDLIWGVTLLNDWSIRDGMGTPRAMSYNLAKNFDGCTSIGPCIVVGELDYRDVPVETKVNGQVRQSFSTKEMVFSFGEVIEYLSRDFTFVPGDIVSGGTGAGTAADSTRRLPDGSRPKDLFLKTGDVVEVSSPKIGTLRNRLV